MRMTPASVLALILCVAAAAFGRTRPACVVATIEGTARVQRAGERQWRELQAGVAIGAQDMLETDDFSWLHLTCTGGNAVVLGGKSRLLLTFRQGSRRQQGAVVSLGGMLFSGAVLYQIDIPCSTAILTPNAAVELLQGTVSVTTDPSTGESGTQVLCGDSVVVRAVSEQRGRTLTRGQVTVIRPGTQAAPAQPITEAHEMILGRLYGRERVKSRLAGCGVHPKPDVSGGADAPEGMRFPSAGDGGVSADRPTTYKRLFSHNRVYGSILSDRAERFWFYRPVAPRGPLFTNAAALAVRGGVAISDGAGYGTVTLSPSYRWRFIDVALELELAQNRSGWGLHQFRDGADGALDLLHHFTLGYPSDSLYIHIGRIDNYTVADGLVVRNYTNRNPYSLFQPAGVQGTALLADVVTISGFVHDITRFDAGGLHAYLHTNGYFLGLGYFYDVNQYHDALDAHGDRFVAVPDTVPRSAREEVHVCEFDLGISLVDNEYLELRLSGDLAYRFKSLLRSDGYVVRVPTLSAGFKGMQIGLGLNQEYGAMTASMFSWYYPTNRYRAVNGGADLLTQNGILGDSRSTRGFHVFYNYAPMPGLAFESTYRQDLLTTGVYKDTTVSGSDNYEYSLAVTVNDTLAPFLHVGRVRVDHAHGTLYPPGAKYADSWGLRVSAYLLTRPFLANIAAEIGFDYYLLDLDFDNRAETSERIYELFAGIRWGFL
jgi:hypothetical protein